MKKLLTVLSFIASSFIGYLSADVTAPSGRFLQIRGTLQPSSTVYFSSGTVQTYLSAEGIFSLPHSATPPPTDCDTDNERGRVYVDTNAVSGQQLFVCEGTLGWIKQGDGGGGGSAQTTVLIKDGGSSIVNTSTFNFTGDNFVVTNSGGEGLIAIDFSSVTSRSDVILKQNTLQSGATFYVSSGTIAGQVSVGSVRFPDGTTQTTVPTGLPGGSNTNVQFNNAGAFGGVQNFVFSNSSNTLTLQSNYLTSDNINGLLLISTATTANSPGTGIGYQFLDINGSTQTAFQIFASQSSADVSTSTLVNFNVRGDNTLDTVMRIGEPSGSTVPYIELPTAGTRLQFNSGVFGTGYIEANQTSGDMTFSPTSSASRFRFAANPTSSLSFLFDTSSNDGILGWDGPTDMFTFQDSLRVANVSLTTFENISTMTFADSINIDMSAINNSSSLEGLKLPQATNCANGTGEGQICWDTNDDVLYVTAKPIVMSQNTLQSGSTFYVSSGSVSGQLSVNSIKFADGTVQVSSAVGGGGGGSGVSVYPATSTASFPFGFSSSTGIFSSNVQIGTPGSTTAMTFDPSASDAILNMYDSPSSPGWSLRYLTSTGEIAGVFGQTSSGFNLSVSTNNQTAHLKTRFSIASTGDASISDRDAVTRFQTGVSSTIISNQLFVSSIATISRIQWADGTVQVSSPVASVGSGGGSEIYPATATPTFPFGQMTSTISAISSLAPVYFSTGITTPGDITISTNGAVSRAITVETNGSSANSKLRLKTDSGFWDFINASSDSDALYITTSTSLNASHFLNFNPALNYLGLGGSPDYRLDVQANANGIVRHYFRNRYGVTNQNRSSLLCVQGDNGNDEMCLQAGKTSANVTVQIVSGSAETQVGVGGTPVMVVGLSSVSFQQPIRAANGTASIPSISFNASGSEDTGFYLAAANTVGLATDGSQSWKVESNGSVTQPRQTGFLAYNSATDSNVTGNNTTITVDFDTERFDVNSNFVGDTYSAPTTGKYFISAGVTLKDTATSNTCEIRLVTTDATYVQEAVPGGARTNLNISVLADMDISDTAFVELNCSGGAAIVDVLGTGGSSVGTGNPTFFSATLMN